jgi:acylphosphatase
MADGRVEICAQGTPEAIQRLFDLIREEPSTTSRPGYVQSSVCQPGSPRAELSGFEEW